MIGGGEVRKEHPLILLLRPPRGTIKPKRTLRLPRVSGTQDEAGKNNTILHANGPGNLRLAARRCRTRRIILRLRPVETTDTQVRRKVCLCVERGDVVVSTWVVRCGTSVAEASNRPPSTSALPPR